MLINAMGAIAIICGIFMIGNIESGMPTGIWYKVGTILALACGGFALGA